MRAAYVDSSCLVAIRFDEAGGRAMSARLESLDRIFSSNLLEAEFLAALAREHAENDNGLLDRLTWILPTRRLGAEIVRILRTGYLRGPDLWHLATALYMVEEPSELPFITLDARQREVAAVLGFPTN
jgi:predicted nucleic acid-binding protein